MGILVVFLIIVGIIGSIFPVLNSSYAEEISSDCIDVFQKIENNNFINVTVKNENQIFGNCDLRQYNNYTHDKTKGVDIVVPHNWYSGIVLYRIGTVDTVAGTYEMKFNFWVEIFDEEDSANFSKNKPDLDFVNKVGDISEEPSKGIIQTEHYYDVMIEGTFYTDMDFKRFPLEKLKLPIIVEPGYDYDEGSLFHSIQFHIWPWDGLFKDGVPSPGYEIVAYNITATDHQYDVGEKYSRFQASFDVQREVFGSVLKFMFPIAVMTGLAVAALVFPSEEYMTKIELNAIFLLGILFFVQIVSEEIPTTGEMTIFDITVVTSYAIIIVTISVPAAKWHQRKKFEDNLEDYEWWDDKDRRFYDLYIEKIKKTEARILLRTVQLSNCKNDQEKSELELEIKTLNEERIKIEQEKETIDSDLELKITRFLEIDKNKTDVKNFDSKIKKWKKVEKFDDENALTENRRYNKISNAIGGGIIGIIIIFASLFINVS